MESVKFEILPKLCLNMIVKNESKIITRLLDSVKDIIDCYCICDTGSTDNTIELIETYFKSKSIPGKIVKEPFKNFEYNRTFALQACKELDADYVLLLDADMILKRGAKYDPINFKLSLNRGDVFYLFQGSNTFYYKNVRIVKNQMNIKYWGVTHEVIHTPDGTKYQSIEKDILFIDDIGDGGAKGDKFTRDIRLLTEGLKEKPNNDRYTFYLANSYRDNNEKEKAIEMYKKRIEIGGWWEEVWQSYYNIGKCYSWLGEHEKAIAYWMLGYDYSTKRLENVHDIINYYRNTSKHKLAYEFYKMAKAQLVGVDVLSLDYLFLHTDVYQYKLDYEYSIVGYYYNPDNIDLAELSMRIIKCPIVERGVLTNVLSNYKFYSPVLEVFTNELTDQLHETNPTVANDFNTSTPSFCYSGDQLIVNRRHVNYYIDENGGYVNRDHIITKNMVSILFDGDTFELGYNTDFDARYIGLEDVRLFEHNDETLFTANRGMPDGKMRVEYGHIDYETKTAVSAVLTKTDGVRDIEKNWVLFADKNGGLKVVYNWAPFTTYDIGHTNTLINRMEQQMPPFFEHVRGSTNGIRVGNETWFICHLVSYEDRRYYYHIVVSVNSDTGRINRWTKLFTFAKEKVEYALGFIRSGDDFLIGYSKMDKTTEFTMVKKQSIEKLFVKP
jgi:tetratricopeptide (TPR) repeat protein